MGLKSSLWSAMPFAAMVMVECGSIGLTTLSKAAMRRGMSNFVFILYSYILATLLLLPFLFICRRAKHPPLTFSILCRLFLLGIVSCISQILQYEGIRSSSPILNSATDNILPAFIFILAIIFRMEPLALKSSYGRAKLLGTLVSITGAFVVTLYKGPSIFISNSSASNLAHQRFLLSPKSNWVFGGFLLSLHILALAFLFIIQASIVKDYQAEFSITFFYCFFGSIPTAFISVIAEKDPSAWILRPNLELIAIIYSAVFACAIRSLVHLWCLGKNGPVYVAMFKPFGIVIAVVMGIAFLGDSLYLGSVVGSAIISLGFYAVMWGKAKERKIAKDNEEWSLMSSTERVPLLQNKMGI